jgi:hypothetical protein
MIAQQWVNVEDEGALPALLRRLESEVPVESIDELWIFPTRRASGAESTVLVLSAFSGEPERRRVSAVHFKVMRDKKGQATVEQHLREYATAPADAVPRVVEGVVRRLGEEAAESPRCEPIAGAAERFEALVRELGGGPKPPPAEPGDGSGGTQDGNAPAAGGVALNRWPDRRDP